MIFLKMKPSSYYSVYKLALVVVCYLSTKYDLFLCKCPMKIGPFVTDAGSCLVETLVSIKISCTKKQFKLGKQIAQIAE